MRKLITNSIFPGNKKRVFFTWFFFLLLGITLNAQNVNWTSGYPKMDTEPIVVLEDDRTLQIRFTPLAADISNANLEVQLPPNVDYISASTPTAGISITASASGSLATGKLVAIQVTSNGNKLLRNNEVQFFVKVNAKCAAAGAAGFDIKVKSGATLVTTGQKNITTNIVVPSLAITSSDGTINYINQTDKNTITYVLKTTTAEKASSAKVTFTADQVSTLSDFKLNGTPLTPKSVINNIYTFEFTPAVLGGNKIDNTNSKVITFKGGATQCGSHVVTANVQFPYNSNCATNMGSMVTMAFGNLPVPEMKHISTNYVNASDATLTYTNVDMNGTTPTLVKTVFQNTGGSNAHNTVLRFNPYGQWCYFDIDNIYVRVGSGTKRKVTTNEIVVISRRGNNANYAYYKPTVAGTKPYTIDIKVTDVVPPNQTISYWIPTINGDIYDNTNRNVFHDYATNTISGIVSNMTSVESPCGDAGVVSTYPYRIAYLNAPHYRQLPASMNIKGGQTRIQTIHVSTGHGSTAPTEFHIQHPSWLSIGAVKMTTNQDGSGTTLAISKVTTPTETKITYSGANTPSCYLHITYTAGACGSSNQTGQIHYWVNQMWPTKALEKISQVYQSVTFQCETAGITLDSFAIRRTTKGYKDSNNDKVPDNGTRAPDNEIRHDVFVEDDEGYFYWKGTIQAPGGYKYLDIPIRTTGFTLGTSGTTVILTGSNTVSTGGTITYNKKDNNNGYFRYQHAGLASGTIVEIKTPFKVITGRNNYDNIETEFYVSGNTPVSNPVFGTTDAKRVGKDKSSAPIGTYNLSRLNHWNKDSRNQDFTNNSLQSIGLGYVDIFHGGYFASPYFSYEVRFHEYLEKLEWNLPKGYVLDSPITITPNTGGAKTLASDGGATTQKIIHNVGSLYDVTFNGSASKDPAKWQRPDDYWKLDLTGKIKATKAAKIGNSTMTRYATYKKEDGTTYVLGPLNVTFIYSGDGVNLEVLPKTVTAYGPKVNNPVLTITNPNSYTMQDVYFYIDGNVKDVILKEAGSGTIYTGNGFNKCWVKISDLANGDSKSYELSYTYNGKPTCDGDTITVYTASGFNASWSPTITLPLDLTDEAHVGVSEEFIIQTAPATVAGSITSDKDTIPEASTGNNYQIKVSFNTLSSTGALKNPEMTLTVPKGQYCTGARLEYPAGTFTPVNAAINSTLAAIASGTENTERTITLKLADAKGSDMLIPGNLTPNVTPAELTASIVLTMEASCETEILNTLQYKGKITGKSACNDAASGNNTELVSQVLFPDISYNYLFDDIAVTTVSGIRAFNEIQTQDTLLLDVKKLIGSTNIMSSSDSIEIQMPQELDVDGSSMFFQGFGNMSGITGTTVTVGNNVVASGVRTLSFPMPVAAYNGAINMGVGDNVSYKIPVKYTPNGQTRAANPVDSIISTIFSKVQFGNCLPQTAPIGDGKDSIALVTADSIPYIVYVGDTAQLKINSNGFTGSWYADKTSGIVLSTDNPWLHSPTDTLALGDTTFYFSSIIDGHDYGRLPYLLSIYIHPWFIQNLDTFKYVCHKEDSLFVHAGGMAVTYQWYYNLKTQITGATDSFYVTGIEGRYHVLVTDSVGETISSDTMSLYLNEVPVFTNNLPDMVTDCDIWRYMLKAETTGHHLIYQWYRDGVEIPGANSAIYYAIAHDSSAYFRVSVKTLCGDSIMSNQCYVYFCDQMDSTLINRTVELIAPNTIDTDPGVGIHRVKSQKDFNFTIKVHEGYSLDYIAITTNDPIWTDQGGIVKEKISENEMKVSIRTVTKPLTVTVSGIVPVSNQEIGDDSSKAWASDNKIYVKTTEAETVYIFTTMGQLYKQEKVKEGISSFDVEPGIYFVKFNNGYTGKVIVK